MFKLSLALTSLACATAASAALAGDLCETTSARKHIDDAKASAHAAGYTNIVRMGEYQGCFEAVGRYNDGSVFEVYIHPTTLEIVKVKRTT